MVQQTS
ncbi:hypothetical protein LINPERPRIM_LOCUS4999 [Linum perenne]